LDLHHAEEAAEAEEVVRVTPPESRDEALRKHLSPSEVNFLFALNSDDGREVFRSASFPRDRTGAERTGRLAFPDGEKWMTVHPFSGYTLRIASPVGPALEVTRLFFEAGLVVVAGAFVLSLVAGEFYARWLLRPLRRLEREAELVGPGGNARIPDELASADDEIGRIARCLNIGYDRIGESVERMRLFSAEVSHELRTPLSIVRLNAERLSGHADATEPLKEMAGEQIAEIGRMKLFISNLLGFARLDAGAVRMETRAVELVLWLGDFAEDATLLTDEAECRFELSGDTSATALFDPVWMRLVLFNLLRNALRFSDKAGLIRLRVEVVGSGLTFTMEDEGPGISPDRLDRIFERYVRFAESRGPSEGVGLGLAICRSVVLLHGGSIRAENREDRSGLRVIIRLPGAVQVTN
jgi:signal transduction histidine kinase